MSEHLSEKMFADTSSLASSQSSQFKNLLEAMLEKLKTDPSSVTVDDARLLFDNFTASDERAVRIISAVEYLAIANKVCIIRNLVMLRLITASC